MDPPLWLLAWLLAADLGVVKDANQMIRGSEVSIVHAGDRVRTDLRSNVKVTNLVPYKTKLYSCLIEVRNNKELVFERCSFIPLEKKHISF